MKYCIVNNNSYCHIYNFFQWTDNGNYPLRWRMLPEQLQFVLLINERSHNKVMYLKKTHSSLLNFIDTISFRCLQLEVEK